MPKAHAYIRVSSNKQGEVSPEAQISAALDYRRLRLPDVEWCKDNYQSTMPGFFADMAVSAWKQKTSWIRNRPGGSALMDSLEEGDHVVFYSIDRAFRNVSRFGLFLEWCLQRNIVCHFIHNSIDLSTASGRMQAQMWAVMAEYYSSILSQRIREACLMKQGKKIKKEKKAPAWDSSEVSFVRKPDKVKEKLPGRVFLYGRVSDQKQVDSELGLRFQSRDLLRFCEHLQKENDLLQPYCDEPLLDKGISAFSKSFRERPIGREIFDKARKGDHIVAVRFDRMFRSVMDANRTISELTDRGVVLHLIDDGVRTDNERSKLMLNVLVSVAQMESEMKSIRQREVNDRLRAKGRPLNKEIPIGCKIVSRKGKKVLVPNRDELVDIYSAMVLTEERGLSAEQAGAYMAALRAHKLGERPTFKHELRHPYVWRSELFPVLYQMAERLPATALASIASEARDQLEIVLDPKALKTVRFKGGKAGKRKVVLEMPF